MVTFGTMQARAHPLRCCPGIFGLLLFSAALAQTDLTGAPAAASPAADGNPPSRRYGGRGPAPFAEITSPELEEAYQKFNSGQYRETIRRCEDGIADTSYNYERPRRSEVVGVPTVRPSGVAEEWRMLQCRALLAIGDYPGARAAIDKAINRFPWSIPMRLTAYEVYRSNGAVEEADRYLEEVNQLAMRRTSASFDNPTLLALGRAALLLGADPRQVLEAFFDRIRKVEPGNREAYLASGQVALDKNDFALAAKTFADGLAKFPKDPEFHFGMARAYEPSDRRQMLKSIEGALAINTNHVPSMLLLADHSIDAEDYAQTRKILDRALAVNPWHPAAWSYRAVLAHLKNDGKAEEEARANALRYWKTNPSVDSLIGKKLAQKYRFAEAAAAQRRALQNDSRYAEARIELAQDLLRLGQEDEGWKLAEAVHHADAYDVTAYNLVTLRGNLAKYKTLTNENFLLRMAPREADLYGGEVLDLLERARKTLCPKYGLELEGATTVEVFEKQKDFAVRTFGMPGNPGYLGVCFGPVITANSPASQAPRPANWQSVLWHEFCHVVTLHLTKNKMPRWLSEGISVYEERQANPTWGQSMTPKFREMILDEDEFTPIGELSAAFLTASDDAHLQFAYYESSLAVEFLSERFGLETMKQILHDLGEGEEINRAIGNHTLPIKELEKDFETFARAKAERLGPDLDWEKPERVASNDDRWIAEHPTNYYALQRRAIKLIRDRKWQEAKVPLQTLIKAYPDQKEPDNDYVLLARAHRELGETAEERAILQRIQAMDPDDWESFLRLAELAAEGRDWKAEAESGERVLAVNPLIPQPYRKLAEAYEGLADPRRAAHCYENLLMLDPPDPADVHFRLARLLNREGDERAKRHVLQALEEAPRFRQAHELLLELSAKKAGAGAGAAVGEGKSP